ncbi:uncharacterized protein BT62DRAFT_1070351 [Guyanagaster necrorhizus]|uniref:Uncharacterized protein n=1 Tax=Guyanagaster necrorhizus TaxID=856835 RepID=A0A9P8AYU9_9AGAR|nr:uncharacterized protein BT62DRAFT_1070351 [Guyanagaster necrorhizus MCA 3950]KAG7452601.1 hypothetical protein BT62DRAFT_1070351 [Guyanagaster necrorhizus MCA 3950]
MPCLPNKMHATKQFIFEFSHIRYSICSLKPFHHPWSFSPTFSLLDSLCPALPSTERNTSSSCLRPPTIPQTKLRISSRTNSTTNSSLPTPRAASAPAEAPAPPVKRGRGRPKGSKNKPTSSSASPAAPRRPRGRPPKEKKEDEQGAESSAPKRGRGRPPKHPRPTESGGEGTANDPAEPPAKRKRGRPKKTTTT